MSSFPAPRTRFRYLLEQYDVPESPITITTEDSGNWAFASLTGFPSVAECARWEHCAEEHSVEYLPKREFYAFRVDELPTEPPEKHTDGGTEPERPPASTVSTESLEDARRMLTNLQDVQIEEEGDVSPWIVAARRAVQMQLSERHDG
jgi:hypothetical protein